MRNHNTDMIGGSARSLASDFVLDAVWLGHIVNFAVQVIFTGDPIGMFILQGSNDPGKEDKNLGGWDNTSMSNWTTIDGQLVTEAGDIMWNGPNCGYLWIRVIYSRTSGTGSLTTARAFIKGL